MDTMAKVDLSAGLMVVNMGQFPMNTPFAVSLTYLPLVVYNLSGIPNLPHDKVRK
jgi:hypothetical protein